jgi:hypothetical protein
VAAAAAVVSWHGCGYQILDGATIDDVECIITTSTYHNNNHDHSSFHDFVATVYYLAIIIRVIISSYHR